MVYSINAGSDRAEIVITLTRSRKFISSLLSFSAHDDKTICEFDPPKLSDVIAAYLVLLAPGKLIGTIGILKPHLIENVSKDVFNDKIRTIRS